MIANNNNKEITISKEKIQDMVESLQKAEFFECHRVPSEVVEQVVRKWLEEHIQSLWEDTVWWFRNEGKDPRELGLPYEDEIQKQYEQYCDKEAVTVGEYDSSWY